MDWKGYSSLKLKEKNQNETSKEGQKLIIQPAVMFACFVERISQPNKQSKLRSQQGREVKSRKRQSLCGLVKEY